MTPMSRSRIRALRASASVASTVVKGPALRNASLGRVRCPAAMTFSAPKRSRRAGTSSVPTWPTAPVTRIFRFRFCHAPSLLRLGRSDRLARGGASPDAVPADGPHHTIVHLRRRIRRWPWRRVARPIRACTTTNRHRDPLSGAALAALTERSDAKGSVRLAHSCAGTRRWRELNLTRSRFDTASMIPAARCRPTASVGRVPVRAARTTRCNYSAFAAARQSRTVGRVRVKTLPVGSAPFAPSRSTSKHHRCTQVLRNARPRPPTR